MNSLFNIKDYVVVITGGTGVLGRAIAKYLALEGAKVAIMGRKEEVGHAIVDDICKAGGEASFYKTDVMDQTVVEQNCQDILDRYGHIDTLLNAAGGNQPGATITPDQTFFDLDAAQFQKVLNLNLTGTVIPTQVFLKPMVEAGKGSIINFSSMAAFRPMTRVCGYAAAKAGISNFTAYMATERRHPCQCHCPGIFHHRAKSQFAHQSRWQLHPTGTGRDTPDTVRAHGRSRRTMWNHPLSDVRCRQICHRHRGRGRRRVQQLRHVALPLSTSPTRQLKAGGVNPIYAKVYATFSDKFGTPYSNTLHYTNEI